MICYYAVISINPQNWGLMVVTPKHYKKGYTMKIAIEILHKSVAKLHGKIEDTGLGLGVDLGGEGYFGSFSNYRFPTEHYTESDVYIAFTKVITRRMFGKIVR
jgi:hypothetical protein